MNALVEIKNTVTKMEPEFAKTLPSHISSEKFVRTAITSIQLNPQVAEADRRSLYGSCMKAAQDGLVLDGREAALVVYSGKNGKVAQYLPMVAGIMKKVRNSGEIATWSVQAVYEKDQFEYELGDDERIVHKPMLGQRGKPIAFYSIVTLKSGEKSREVMGVDEVQAIRQRSRAKDSGPWVTDFAEMGKKTVVRRHSKRLPMSSDLEALIRSDDNLYSGPVIDGEHSVVDDHPHEPAPEYENISQDPADHAPKQTRAARVVKAKVAKPVAHADVAMNSKGRVTVTDHETGEIQDADYAETPAYAEEEVPI